MNQVSFENVHGINVMNTIRESGILSLCPYTAVTNEEWLHYAF